MREIKFKAYDPECEEWFYSDKEYDDHFFMFQDGKLIALGVRETSGSIDEPPGHESYELEEPLQFTGLRDKNGIEIWEGDIIRHIGYGVGIVKHSLDHAAEFRRMNGIFGDDDFLSCWGMQTKRGDGAYFTSFCNWCRPCQYMEVIGNRFENPELLESQTGEINSCFHKLHVEEKP